MVRYTENNGFAARFASLSARQRDVLSVILEALARTGEPGDDPDEKTVRQHFERIVAARHELEIEARRLLEGSAVLGSVPSVRRERHADRVSLTARARKGRPVRGGPGVSGPPCTRRYGS